MKDIRKIKIGSLMCACGRDIQERISYLLLPVAIADREIVDLSVRYSTGIVVITGMDWDNDLTPWPARGVFPSDEDFQGNAGHFLAQLKNEVIPEIEGNATLSENVERNLAGISLSGLFALWAWMQDDTFDNIASISGSFWYDGFTEWLTGFDIPLKKGGAYLSLGDREGNTTDNPRFQIVQPATQSITKILESHNIHTVFEQTKGTHFAPMLPRLHLMLQAMNQFHLK